MAKHPESSTLLLNSLCEYLACVLRRACDMSPYDHPINRRGMLLNNTRQAHRVRLLDRHSLALYATRNMLPGSGFLVDRPP